LSLRTVIFNLLLTKLSSSNSIYNESLMVEISKIPLFISSLWSCSVKDLNKGISLANAVINRTVPGKYRKYKCLASDFSWMIIWKWNITKSNRVKKTVWNCLQKIQTKILILWLH
jgi:hypothetical protein